MHEAKWFKVAFKCFEYALKGHKKREWNSNKYLNNVRSNWSRNGHNYIAVWLWMQRTFSSSVDLYEFDNYLWMHLVYRSSKDIHNYMFVIVSHEDIETFTKNTTCCENRKKNYFKNVLALKHNHIYICHVFAHLGDANQSHFARFTNS